MLQYLLKSDKNGLRVVALENLAKHNQNESQTLCSRVQFTQVENNKLRREVNQIHMTISGMKTTMGKLTGMTAEIMAMIKNSQQPYNASNGYNHPH